MKMPPLSRRQRMLVLCAPFSEGRITDRAMRAAVFRVRKADAFNHQLAFDRAVAEVIQHAPVPPEVAEWFTKETTVAPPKRTWKTIATNPAIVAVGIAVVVIATVFAFRLLERMSDFPGADTARKLLTSASSSHSIVLDPVKTDAGALGDLFFMKHRLNHYDVPPEFADLKTLGCRVFDDEEGHRVAQIFIIEKHMQFFLFPAERDPKTGATKEFSDWRYVDQEGWTGVVKQKNGVCFMAALHGREKELTPYIEKAKP
jgi:hypothetical protein